MQREIYSCLTILEIKSPDKNYDLDLKQIKEQYLKLAQQYHPDMQ